MENKYPLVWHKDDFQIKVFCSIPNIATGILIKASDNYFIVDPGDGILRDLNSEISTKNILDVSDIFISHGHHDHVGGVWTLLTYMRVLQKSTPLSLHFPKGCKEIISIYRAFEQVYSNSIPYKIILNEIPDTKEFKSSKGLTIKPFPVIHKEILNDRVTKQQVPAIGFTFEHDGKKICYGGDTAYCIELENAAKGCDLAVIEAGHDEEEEGPDDMHMTLEEAKKIGNSAKEYFLVHVPE